MQLRPQPSWPSTALRDAQPMRDGQIDLSLVPPGKAFAEALDPIGTPLTLFEDIKPLEQTSENQQCQASNDLIAILKPPPPNGNLLVPREEQPRQLKFLVNQSSRAQVTMRQLKTP